ncbi:MAG TPA: group 1 truncated hemoglobin [Myxococcota bacterium]|nr:group 1 truncated hemoglobin [Myxococcota bacterium]
MERTNVATSLYERLGGEPAIEAAVGIFYEKLLGDELLVPFFDGVDMAKQARKQRAFLAYALGGPQKWTGRSMRAAHATAVRRGLSDEHFDRVAGHLVDTLGELGVAKAEIDDVVAVVGSTRDDVLNR